MKNNNAKCRNKEACFITIFTLKPGLTRLVGWHKVYREEE